MVNSFNSASASAVSSHTDERRPWANSRTRQHSPPARSRDHSDHADRTQRRKKENRIVWRHSSFGMGSQGSASSSVRPPARATRPNSVGVPVFHATKGKSSSEVIKGKHTFTASGSGYCKSESKTGLQFQSGHKGFGNSDDPGNIQLDSDGTPRNVSTKDLDLWSRTHELVKRVEPDFLSTVIQESLDMLRQGRMRAQFRHIFGAVVSTHETRASNGHNHYCSDSSQTSPLSSR